MISVIIPVYNTKPYLEQAIKSVLHQSYQDWEQHMMLLSLQVRIWLSLTRNMRAKAFPGMKSQQYLTGYMIQK